MYKYSKDAVVKKLDLFYTPPTNTSVKCIKLDYIDTDSSLSGTSIVFELNKGDMSYYDLSALKLQALCKITKKDGSVPDAADKVFPINNLLRSMWKDVKFEIGDQNISESDGDYHYKSFIKTLLYEVKDEAMTNKLATGLFYADTNGAHDSFNGDNDPFNDGAFNRINRTSGGREFLMEGTIGEDFFDSKLYLLNDIKMKLTLTRNEDQVILMANDGTKGYKLQIMRLTVLLPLADVGAAIVTGHAAGLEEGGLAQYFFKQSKLIRHEIAPGLTTKDIKVHSSGPIPNRVVVVFVSDDRYDGGYNINPFHFDHLNIQSIRLETGGRSIPSSSNQTYNFTTRNYGPLLNDIYEVGPNSCINYENFDKGYALFVFNINTMEDSSNRLMLQESGEVKLAIRFGRPVPANYKALTYSEFQSCVQVDRNRKVKYSGNTTAK